MDIGTSITYVFRDKNWLTKLAIGAAILLVSIPLTPILVGFIGIALVLGYGLDVMRNVRNGVAQPLPEWRDHWGEWMVSGLKYLLLLLIWSLPALLLNGFNGLGNQLMWRSDGFVEFMGSSILIATACLGTLWWIFFFLILPAMTIRFAETEDVRAGLNFNDIYFLTRNNLGDVIVAVVASAVAFVGRSDGRRGAGHADVHHRPGDHAAGRRVPVRADRGAHVCAGRLWQGDHRAARSRPRRRRRHRRLLASRNRRPATPWWSCPTARSSRLTTPQADPQLAQRPQ